MKNNVILQELEKYELSSLNEIKNAFREIIQKIILAGLERAKIFNYVAFYGGTSLRIIHHLDRFSEDLGFTLIKDCTNFDLNYYLNSAIRELKSYGIESFINIKSKNIDTSVYSGYIKTNLMNLLNVYFDSYMFEVSKEENIVIKIDVETNYYKGFNFEYKTLLFPSYFKVLTYDYSTLFSSKIIAILKRNWKNRVKGRDYFDFLFYITQNIKPNYDFLSNALSIEKLDNNKLKEMLKNRFEEVDYKLILDDLLPFIDKNHRFIPLFKKEIFIDLLDELK